MLAKVDHTHGQLTSSAAESACCAGEFAGVSFSSVQFGSVSHVPHMHSCPSSTSQAWVGKTGWARWPMPSSPVATSWLGSTPASKKPSGKAPPSASVSVAVAASPCRTSSRIQVTQARSKSQYGPPATVENTLCSAATAAAGSAAVHTHM